MNKCGICNRQFSSRNYIRHILKRKKICKNPSRYCEVCNKGFSSRSSLSNHKKKCKSEKRLPRPLLPSSGLFIITDNSKSASEKKIHLASSDPTTSNSTSDVYGDDSHTMEEVSATDETADTYTQAEKDDIEKSSADNIELESTDGTPSIDEVKTGDSRIDGYFHQLQVLFRLLLAGQTSVTHAFVDTLNRLWRNGMFTDEERDYILRYPFFSNM